MTSRMPERARTDLREPQGSNPLGPPGPELPKRATGGHLPLIPTAKKLAAEIHAGASKEETPEGVLAEEARVIANAKKMSLQAVGGAVQKFREKLAGEQELIGALANIVMEIYAMESGLLRRRRPRVARAKPRQPS